MRGGERRTYRVRAGDTDQSTRFDRGAVYVRRWVPELAALPDRWIHEPWRAPATVLRTAGISLGVDYPTPLVEHEAARRAALQAFVSIRG